MERPRRSSHRHSEPGNASRERTARAAGARMRSARGERGTTVAWKPSGGDDKDIPASGAPGRVPHRPGVAGEPLPGVTRTTDPDDEWSPPVGIVLPRAR